MKISSNGLDLIKHFEDFRSCPYLDSVGVPTIGYGTTRYNDRHVRMDDHCISEATAEVILEGQINDLYGSAVNNYVTGYITQDQFDALVSFTYNLGAHALRHSSLLRYVNEGNITQAANEFQKWIHAGGKVLKGLIARRQKERELFLTS